MKRKSLLLVTSVALCGSMLFSSCIGSFGLSNKLLSWNRNIDSKFVNELVFIAFWIVPVYEISALADALVLNTIEFWSGSNPVAEVGTVKNVEGKDGLYAVETREDGYRISKQGEDNVVDLKYDKSTRTWSAEADGQTAKLFSFTDGDEVVMYLPDGKEMQVELNENGTAAFEQMAKSYAFFAAR